ncbi:hypothetical protein TWF718_000415 [Orbilia javanica]|uniref:Uncharacterized protein n=1 Tax=Orbilia javanica TaxID=47235 RepID=A0AAN8RRM0_9PEZI
MPKIEENSSKCDPTPVTDDSLHQESSPGEKTDEANNSRKEPLAPTMKISNDDDDDDDDDDDSKLSESQHKYINFLTTLSESSGAGISASMITALTNETLGKIPKGDQYAVMLRVVRNIVNRRIIQEHIANMVTSWMNANGEKNIRR